ncbi:cytochrome P450 [Castellaniella sp. GW247-6E4]|uniref:cytochrome P450 n=1 Tax=Castellaniella sp. GW247-6E4 TaxID=3140380 RepID=UPI00331503BF
MSTHNDWDPRAPEVLANPIHAYDAMRKRCPVAHSDAMHHSVFQHADVMRILLDPETFSNRTAGCASVPHGMDPPEHTPYRRLIEPYFSPARMAAFRPECERICAELTARLPRDGELEIMFDFAHPFSLSMQCAFLGWPEELHAPLLDWIHKKNLALLSGEAEAVAAVATEFDGTILRLLDARRTAGPDAPDDATTRLMHETVEGRPIADDAIVSILRNWTVGELGTIASSVGIIAHYLAERPRLQERLRANPDLVRAANDEILRMHAPLIANRRTLTRNARIGDKNLSVGERVTLMWASANRDEAVFGDPDEFRLDRDPGLNLLYGVGVHACPGAPLARLELEAVVRALLAATREIAPVADASPIPSVYPAGGYREARLRIRR